MSQSSASQRTVAIIGFGSRISGVLCNLLKVEPRLRMVGYADPAPAGRDHAIKQGVDVGQGFTDAGDMLATLKPDYVMIGSPNHLHLEHITVALEAGCHVFSEKPVVINPEDTWAAAELLRKHGQERFLVGLVLRSSELFKRVHAAIAEGKIGRPVSMEANEILTPEHGGFLMRDWRRLRKYSGSHILEKCCHDLDLHQAVLGSRIVRAASFGGRSIFTPENRADLEKGADGKQHYQQWRSGWNSATGESVFTSDADITDHQVVIAECENGARLTFHCNNHGAFGQRRWLICGHKGSIESDLSTGAIRLQQVYGESQNLSLGDSGGGHYGADEGMAKDLSHAWFEGKTFPVTTRAALEAGLAAMIIDKAQQDGAIADGSAWFQRLDAILSPKSNAASV
jgi:predicted dehydrogenase